jgi:endonuclease/exonuclease/phosphatase family metal-dependent hydrolase
VKLFFKLLLLLSAQSALSQAATTPLAVMTFNIENGGTQINFQKVVTAIKRSKADIVGIQEAWGNTPRLARELGWKYYSARHHILSKFPLYETKDRHHNYVLVEVKPQHFVAMANVHLPDEPYGPDLVKQNESENQIILNELKVRLPTALPAITHLNYLARQGFPVFLTGDFNSPSHLDWTASTRNILPNHRVAVPWPVTKALENSGFIDSYRESYPDPLQDPGYTWPGGRPTLTKSIDHFNPSANDSPDRLDFVFTAGASKVLDSHIVGESHNNLANIQISPWPSDHRAVVSYFEVSPQVYATAELSPIIPTPVTHKPSLHLSKHRFLRGEAIRIDWVNAPGNGYDYISIVPVGSKQNDWEQAARLYTRGEINGWLRYSSDNSEGNWPAWFKNPKATWPLAPGRYEIQLRLDDSYTVLASTSLVIT